MLYCTCKGKKLIFFFWSERIYLTLSIEIAGNTIDLCRARWAVSGKESTSGVVQSHGVTQEGSSRLVERGIETFLDVGLCHCGVANHAKVLFNSRVQEKLHSKAWCVASQVGSKRKSCFNEVHRIIFVTSNQTLELTSVPSASAPVPLDSLPPSVA